MAEEILDHPDTAHTNPVDTLFGNLHQELGKIGCQGFDKILDDLAIKYSVDHIDNVYQRRQLLKDKKAENNGTSSFQSPAIFDWG